MNHTQFMNNSLSAFTLTFSRQLSSIQHLWHLSERTEFSPKWILTPALSALEIWWHFSLDGARIFSYLTCWGNYSVWIIASDTKNFISMPISEINVERDLTLHSHFCSMYQGFYVNLNPFEKMKGTCQEPLNTVSVLPSQMICNNVQHSIQTSA